MCVTRGLLGRRRRPSESGGIVTVRGGARARHGVQAAARPGPAGPAAGSPDDLKGAKNSRVKTIVLFRKKCLVLTAILEVYKRGVTP